MIDQFPDRERAQAICDLYEEVLQRRADEHGLEAHYNSGRPIEELRVQFLNSREHRRKSMFWRNGYDISEIGWNLLVGTRIEPGKEVEARDKYGIQAVVRLNEGNNYDETVFDHFTSPTFPDGQLMPVNKAIQAFEFLDEHVPIGHKTLVHCHWGGSRSPSITAMYLALKTRQTFDQALDIVKSHRDVVGISHGLLTDERITEIMRAGSRIVRR